MEGIKSAKLNKTLTSQDVTTHLEVLCSSGGAIQSLIAVLGKGEVGQSSGIQQVTEQSPSPVGFSCTQILSRFLGVSPGWI